MACLPHAAIVLGILTVFRLGRSTRASIREHGALSLVTGRSVVSFQNFQTHAFFWWGSDGSQPPPGLSREASRSFRGGESRGWGRAHREKGRHSAQRDRCGKESRGGTSLLSVRFRASTGWLEPVGAGTVGLEGGAGPGHCSFRCALARSWTLWCRRLRPSRSAKSRRREGCEHVGLIPFDGSVPSVDIKKVWGEGLGSDPIPTTHFTGQ